MPDELMPPARLNLHYQVASEVLLSVLKQLPHKRRKLLSHHVIKYFTSDSNSLNSRQIGYKLNITIKPAHREAIFVFFTDIIVLLDINSVRYVWEWADPTSLDQLIARIVQDLLNFPV